MVIYLPSQSLEEKPILDELTPAEIVRELDKYVIGQAEAKRAVAIALRNRIRRQKLRRPDDGRKTPHVQRRITLRVGAGRPCVIL